MHDVGKIGIPDRILLKPGALDAEERAIMQTPHRRSAPRSSPAPRSPLLQMAEEIALHPPRALGRHAATRPGLAGEEIPLGGAHLRDLRRLRRAASPRAPTRSAWTLDDGARRARSAQRGRHFDPALVDAFLALVPDARAGPPAAGFSRRPGR